MLICGASPLLGWSIQHGHQQPAKLGDWLLLQHSRTKPDQPRLQLVVVPDSAIGQVVMFL